MFEFQGSGRIVAAAILAVVGLGALPPASAQAATVVGAGTYQNGSSAVTSSGPWTTIKSSQDNGGSFSNLAAPGSAELSFNTSGIQWISRRNAYAGIADVYVDGTKKASVDLYSAKTQYQQVVYKISGLKEVKHTIRIVRTGTKTAASGGRNIVLDAFIAPDIYAPMAPTRLATAANGSGAKISWVANTEPDVAGYRVYRREGTAGKDSLVGTTTAPTTSFADVGLADSTSYEYRVLAFDISKNESKLSMMSSLTTAARAADTGLRYANCPTATVTVSTGKELTAAIAGAQAGTVIQMNSGTYSGEYRVTIKATSSAPAWICGPRTAVVDGGGPGLRGGFRVDGSSNLILAGMTVRNSQKGIFVINSNSITVADTRVSDIGEEAVHLKFNTTDSTVIGNSIAHTGLLTPAYGEGVYVGTARPNWCLFGGDCNPDRSDRNTIVGNDISDTAAQNVDVKEGASDGIITRNTLNGVGMSSASDSLVVIQGNGWTVSKNAGQNSPKDGVQVWEQSVGWGRDNVIYANTFTGSMPGYAVRLSVKDLGNIVGCDNVRADNSIALTNRTCQL